MAPPPNSWSPAIETGIAEIDDQHRRLFDMAAAFRGDGDQVRVSRSLAMLCDYANTHLRDEEALLASIAYEKLDEHRREHERFRSMLRQLLDQSRGLSLDEIAARIETLINGLFYRHILTFDAAYVESVKGRHPD